MVRSVRKVAGKNWDRDHGEVGRRWSVMVGQVSDGHERRDSAAE